MTLIVQKAQVPFVRLSDVNEKLKVERRTARSTLTQAASSENGQQREVSCSRHPWMTKMEWSVAA